MKLSKRPAALPDSIGTQRCGSVFVSLIAIWNDTSSSGYLFLQMCIGQG